MALARWAVHATQDTEHRVSTLGSAQLCLIQGVASPCFLWVMCNVTEYPFVAPATPKARRGLLRSNG